MVLVSCVGETRYFDADLCTPLIDVSHAEVVLQADRTLRPVAYARPSSAAHVRTWTTGRRIRKDKYMELKRIWVCVIALFFHKLYGFGDWILATAVKLIDAHDQFWEEIEQKIENQGDWDELD